MGLSAYQATTMNWREQLRRNERKTKIVIALFIALYGIVGLLIDILLVQSQYPQATITQALYALGTGRIVPYATIILGLVALLSLWVTYMLHDKLMLLGTNAREITAQTARSLQEKQLVHVVEEMKVAAGLQYMPKVYLIEADYMNAFASGYSERSAMVAITRGLMEKLDRAELQAVMAHELSHIRHHDIKLTLMVAILSNLMLIVIDSLFYSLLFKRDRRDDNRLVALIMVLRYLLPIITVMLALFLSRTREYMADAGAVELMRDNEPMARALLKIHEDHQVHAEQYARAYADTPHEQVRQTSYLFDPAQLLSVKSLSNLFSTHPDLASRLKSIGFHKQ